MIHPCRRRITWRVGDFTCTRIYLNFSINDIGIRPIQTKFSQVTTIKIQHIC